LGEIRPVGSIFCLDGACDIQACNAPIVVESAQRDYLRAGLPVDEFYADAFTSEADKATAATA
jgi:hypothetical protein